MGKTHLATRWLALNGRTFSVNLLEPEDYERYLRYPGRLLADNEGAHKGQRLSVLIDEIQKLSVLLDVVHHLYEKHHKQIQFLLTGSSARKLNRQGANLLAGRALSLKLFPLDSSEYFGNLKQLSESELFRELLSTTPSWSSRFGLTFTTICVKRFSSMRWSERLIRLRVFCSSQVSIMAK